MSYDLDQLHLKYGLKFASIRFATSSDVAGVTVIPAVTGAQAIIHQVAFAASSWSQVQLDRATAAGSSYWQAMAGQTEVFEGVRIPCDAGASVIADVASISVTTGSGFLHVWYVYQKSSGVDISTV